MFRLSAGFRVLADGKPTTKRLILLTVLLSKSTMILNQQAIGVFILALTATLLFNQ